MATVARGDVKLSNLKTFETGGKLSQFDWPFSKEANKSGQKDVKN